MVYILCLFFYPLIKSDSTLLFVAAVHVLAMLLEKICMNECENSEIETFWKNNFMIIL